MSANSKQAPKQIHISKLVLQGVIFQTKTYGVKNKVKEAVLLRNMTIFLIIKMELH